MPDETAPTIADVADALALFKLETDRLNQIEWRMSTNAHDDPQWREHYSVDARLLDRQVIGARRARKTAEDTLYKLAWRFEKAGERTAQREVVGHG